MAEPITTAKLVKAAATAVANKKNRNKIGNTLVAIAVVVLLPFLLIVSIFSNGATGNQEIALYVFHGGQMPSGISQELAEYLDQMREVFERLEVEIEEINNSLEDGSVDDIRVKAVFFGLFFGRDLDYFPDDFYKEFVYCFIIQETVEPEGEETEPEEVEPVFILLDNMDEIYSNVTSLIGRTVTEEERININNLYNFVRYGYASDGLLGPPGEAFDDATFAQLMREATKHIGRPYVWGGNSPSTSFDCSGFICWTYSESGVYNLPRTTAQGIYNQCTPIAQAEAKPGDLVFFTRTYETSNTVTHLGIYVGNNQMLHAGDPIGYADLGSSFWRSHFYGYGRLPL